MRPHPATTNTPPTVTNTTVHRVEVRTSNDQSDPLATSIGTQARRFSGLGSCQAVRTARVYLIEAPLGPDDLDRIAGELLADPVTQEVIVGSAASPTGDATIEVHYQPGVMDPVAQSTQDAIVEMLPGVEGSQVSVRTGQRYDLTFSSGTAAGDEVLRGFAEAALANPVIHDIHLGAYWPKRFPQGGAYALRVVHVPIRELDEDGLARLSRDGHLFLNPDEMCAIQDHYRQLDRDPTDAELETLAQTWSEHCVHKTLKATIRYTQAGQTGASTTPGPSDWADRPGHTLNADGSVTIENLLKSTIAAATRRLMEEDASQGRRWCVSVFEDNAGIVQFDDHDAVCIKVETHNHPSAIEPYGGAATGIGGCIRDIMGTGLAARPIANTDTFCVAPPGRDAAEVPEGVLHPRRVLGQVVAGVRDYGNRMGIPTINGAVWFHEDYLANPLVFAGCVGVMPLDKCFGNAEPGDRIIVLGGRTGRDGIHGATFSSAELTDTHTDEFAHAVQIGNAITQKKTLDVILQARDHVEGPLYRAITDCGAGGFSSAVGEMGETVGARVTLETAPLKYEGLSYTEIWISEAQERMVLAVPSEQVAKLRALCESEDVDMCDLGEFGAADGGGGPELILMYKGTEVGRLSMDLLHHGLPTPTRRARWSPTTRPSSGPPTTRAARQSNTIAETLYALLGHPNIASKHWIIEQYDHEVQGSSVLKPLVGPDQQGPGDAAVIRPKLDSSRGVAIACGLQTGLGEDAVVPGQGDSYWMALAAIDEAVRNCVCVGGDPERIAILDNFCWPGCDDPSQLGKLVRAAQACYDGAIAYRTPFISGKDSLNNQFTTESGELITIPPTLLISALAIVADTNQCVSMDAKSAGNVLLIVGQTTPKLAGSHYQMVARDRTIEPDIPRVDLDLGPRTAVAVAGLIADGLVASAHDCSDGGLLVGAAEMAFAGRLGLDLDLNAVPREGNEVLDPVAACFAETPSRYLLEVAPDRVEAAADALRQAGVLFAKIGTFADHERVTVRLGEHGQVLDEPIDKLCDAWRAPLDW